EDPNDGRPLVGLGDPADVKAVYRGERRVEVRVHDRKAARTERRARSSPILEELPEVQALFAALREWRRAAALAQAVPPYVIFHDKTLLEIARARPASLPALGLASGVGTGKLERYGPGVLEVVRRAEP
ncbi:MAG: HRDC domain-containing protein, partial [Pseudomonadota bacterium]|nr:HRDC domain-containing protein [Pseudomonadota bacterium]